MNKLEKIIYDNIKYNPKIKNAIRNIYQTFFDILPRLSNTSLFPVKARKGFFFGFHDHSPFSSDNEKLLANKPNIPLRMPHVGEELEIGYFHGEDFADFVPVATTKAWQWHMGCKLQWRGKSSSEVIFNDYVDDINVSRVIDILNAEEFILPAPIASVSPDGKWGVGYSFERVQKYMPGYGYPQVNSSDSEINERSPRNNGIHIIDIDKKKTKLILSLNQLAQIKPTPSMDGAFHFVTHAVFSPSSQRFIFLHRWTRMENLAKRWSRLISSDIEGNNIFIFPGTEMVSHIGWRGEGQVIAYCGDPGLEGDRYVLFDDLDFSSYEVFDEAKFNSDGHPSFDSSGRWMITDTYPNRRRMQNLILYDYKNKERIDLASLYMPKKFQSPNIYKHWACDLHPRWDNKGRYISFDAIIEGERSLCTMDITSLTKQLEI